MKYVFLPLFLIFASIAIAQDGSAARLREIRDALAPCLVRVETTGGLEKVGENLAIHESTGVFVSTDGFFVSSAVGFAHQPDAILVQTSDGKRFPAKLVATDEARNLALLKIETENCAVPGFLPCSEMRVGQDTFAFGRVLHPTLPSLTSGILSAKNRIDSLAIQTSAHTSPDNYGGVLADWDGRVLGVITPFGMERNSSFDGVEIYDSGVGFAIPFENVLKNLELWKKGDFKRPPKLGVLFDNPNPALSSTRILSVESGSLAEKAGIQTNDIILSVDGKKVRRGSDVLAALAPHRPGDTVEFVVSRAKNEVTIQILLQNLEKTEEKS